MFPNLGMPLRTVSQAGGRYDDVTRLLGWWRAQPPISPKPGISLITTKLNSDSRTTGTDWTYDNLDRMLERSGSPAGGK